MVRCAIVSSLIAVLLAALAGIAMTWGASFISEAGVGWAVTMLSNWLVPVLVVLGIVCLARERSLLTEGRALAVLSFSAVAFAFGALALIGFGQSFEAADQDVPETGLGAIWWPLLLASWIAGSMTSALFLDALLARTQLHRVTVLARSIPLGALVAASVAPTLITPVFAGLAGVAVAVLSLAAVRPAVDPHEQQARQSARVPTRQPSHPTPAPRRTVRSLSVVSAVTSTVAVIYAFTGSLWPLAAVDSTIAMGQGISMALFSAVPLVAAVGLLLASRSRRATPHTWGPLALLVMSFGAVAAAYLPGPDDWDSAAPGFAAAATLSGCAVAWWLTSRLRGPRAIRIAIGLLCGLAYAAFFGLLGAPMLAFAVPLGAIALAIWPGKRLREVDPTPTPAPVFSH